MSVEITIKAPHGTALHDKITELLVIGIAPATETIVSDGYEAKAVSSLDDEAETLNRLGTDAGLWESAFRKALTGVGHLHANKVDVFSWFANAIAAGYAAGLAARNGELKCVVDPAVAAKYAQSIAENVQLQPAGLMTDQAYEKAFSDELRTVLTETNTKPKHPPIVQRLGTDACAWAKEFLDAARIVGFTTQADEESMAQDPSQWLISWLELAIEAGRAAGAAAQKDKPETAERVRAFETDDDPHTDAARNAQQEHLDEAANLASSSQWQRENLVLDHLRSFVSTGDFNIGIRTVINGGFIVVSTSSGEDAVTASTVTDLVSCTSPAELLSAIALICAFAEHG